MFVVLDTNILTSSVVLNSAAGAAIRFFIRRKGATLVIPEVVRMELESNVETLIKAKIESTEAGHRWLLSLFGSLKALVLPTEDEIMHRVSSLLASLDVPVRYAPFTMEAAKSSLLKIMSKRPPSMKNQQFKDGVIWANCIELLQESDVYLVSDDRAFCQSQDAKQGLAQLLELETVGLPHKLRFAVDLDGLLDDIQGSVQVDETLLVETLISKGNLSTIQELEDRGLELQHPPVLALRLYLTESATRLYLTYNMKFRCNDTIGGVYDALFEVEGNGSFDTNNQAFIGLSALVERLTYTDVNGTHQSAGVKALGSIVLGHRSVRHSVQRLLE